MSENNIKSQLNINFKVIADFIIICLIISDTFLLILSDFSNLSTNLTEDIIYFDLMVCFVLFCEFMFRLKNAENKKEFFKDKWVWLDIIAMIPLNFFAFRLFRFARLVRVLRLLMLLRFFALFRKSFTKFNKFIKESHLDWSFGVLIFSIFAGTIIYCIVEFGNKANTYDIWESFSYVTQNIINAGAVDVTPHTLIGKVLGIVLMVTGAIFFGMFTASLATWLVTKSKNEQDAKEESELNELKELVIGMQSEIKELKDLIKKNK
ncbi:MULTISPECIES: ion transporter [Methanobacterium]|uniref:Ion transport domain-containing protein n=1 Tax=Methanobacterium bryantii TaxID=2161 RepID=A0A2A2H920_METBR|nr:MULTISPECIES: potassium channel family protein [Methanobacterium]OEC85678.1 hypothetical protein A9507_13050 [Methanobacterium sp. A39]PAV05887.1 hypothetical protein ASJ80_13570 [Methanobacterium bryantii]